MKRIISLTLALLMLVAMLCAATSCEFGMESKTGYTQFRDHIIQEVGFDKNLTLDEYVSARVATLDGDDSGSGSGSSGNGDGDTGTGNDDADDWDALGGDSNRRAVIFSPYGGVVGDASITFVFTEAAYSEDGADGRAKYEYPNEDNSVSLVVNFVTGRVKTL